MAKGILGKKLGMTQVFDPETGAVTPVTVIEAGPCPVVQVQDAATDGYDAVQLAFEPVAERKLTKPELGHLEEVRRRRRTASSSSSAAAIDGAVEGETVTVEVFEPGDTIKVAGHRRSARASRARSSATTSARGPRSHGSHNIRKPGSIGASATPSRVFKGMKMAGPHGRQARHPARADRRTRSTSSGTCCSSRARSRARRTASSEVRG